MDNIPAPCFSGSICPTFPVSPESTIVPDPARTSDTTAVDDVFKYTCANGMKFADDFAKLNVGATCRDGNTWEEPTWGTCVDSNIAECIISKDPL